MTNQSQPDRPRPRDLEQDILLCLDAIESKGPGCVEWELLKALIAEKDKGAEHD